MPALRLLLALLTLAAAACGAVKSNADAGADDAAAADAGGTVLDAAIDAPTDLDGRPPEIDGGTTLAEACGALCPDVITCGEGGGLEECLGECQAELGDCSEAELDAALACTGQGCKTLFGCFEEIGCLGGGGEVCGDESCDGGENCVSCAQDCGECPFECGDGTCSGELGEGCDVCPADCGECLGCGDGVCSVEIGERCETCPDDCGACVCGDAICSVGECASCGSDCPNGCDCPHDTCTLGIALDPGCGTCAATLCEVDSYCCFNNFDGICIGESESVCGLDCPANCGDGYCDPLENTQTCPNDCPPS
jgi:hypothetical protein